jgi:hypothetical protein
MSTDHMHGDLNQGEGSFPPAADGIVEVSLLLPGWQAAALEATAHVRGITAGQMVRTLIGEFFCKFAQPRPA